MAIFKLTARRIDSYFERTICATQGHTRKEKFEGILSHTVASYSLKIPEQKSLCNLTRYSTVESSNAIAAECL